jgi:hypothetical protein
MTFIWIAAILLSLGLIGLGVYFHSWLAPWRALLRRAAKLGPSQYRGRRASSNWLLIIDTPEGRRSYTVPEAALGLFLLQQALADLPAGPATTLAEAVGPALGLGLAQPWQFKYRSPRRSAVMERVPATFFSLSRDELLRAAARLLPPELAQVNRTARS